MIGSACVTTCLPMMVACSLAGHHLVAMLGGAALGAIEKRSFRPSIRLIAGGNLVLALVSLLLF